MTLAPYFALLFAVLPVIRLHVAWQAGRIKADLALSSPASNLLVAGLSTVVIVFMGLYWVAENF